MKLQIWDTAGQENFKSITRTYFRSSAVALIVYDVTKRKSFEDVVSWFQECQKHGNETLICVLVGNKTDLEEQREVSFEEGEQFAKENQMLFLESSAKSSENVRRIFGESAELVMKKIESREIDPSSDSQGVKIGLVAQEERGLETVYFKEKKGGKCC